MVNNAGTNYRTTSINPSILSNRINNLQSGTPVALTIA